MGAFGGGYAGQVKSTSYMSQPATQITTSSAAKLEGALRSIIRGKDDVVRLAIVSVVARGHLLIEGVPGVGKTTLGHALARAIACTCQGVRFISDLLPGECLCISIYSALAEVCVLKPVRVCSNLLFD